MVWISLCTFHQLEAARERNTDESRHPNLWVRLLILPSTNFVLERNEVCSPIQSPCSSLGRGPITIRPLTGGHSLIGVPEKWESEKPASGCGLGRWICQVECSQLKKYECTYLRNLPTRSMRRDCGDSAASRCGMTACVCGGFPYLPQIPSD